MAESIFLVFLNFLAGWLLAKRRFVVSMFTVVPFIFRTLLQAPYPSHFVNDQVQIYLAHIKRADSAERTFRLAIWKSDLTFTEKLILLNLGEVGREKYALDQIKFLETQKEL